MNERRKIVIEGHTLHDLLGLPPRVEIAVLEVHNDPQSLIVIVEDAGNEMPRYSALGAESPIVSLTDAQEQRWGPRAVR